MARVWGPDGAEGSGDLVYMVVRVLGDVGLGHATADLARGLKNAVIPSRLAWVVRSLYGGLAVRRETSHLY
jgi:hypothetical protein